MTHSKKNLEAQFYWATRAKFYTLLHILHEDFRSAPAIRNTRTILQRLCNSKTVKEPSMQAAAASCKATPNWGKAWTHLQYRWVTSNTAIFSLFLATPFRSGLRGTHIQGEWPPAFLSLPWFAEVTTGHVLPKQNSPLCMGNFSVASLFCCLVQTISLSLHLSLSGFLHLSFLLHLFPLQSLQFYVYVRVIQYSTAFSKDNWELSIPNIIQLYSQTLYNFSH